MLVARNRRFGAPHSDRTRVLGQATSAPEDGAMKPPALHANSICSELWMISQLSTPVSPTVHEHNSIHSRALSSRADRVHALIFWMSSFLLGLNHIWERQRVCMPVFCSILWSVLVAEVLVHTVAQITE